MTRVLPLFAVLALAGCANAPAVVEFTDADRAAIASVTNDAIAIANAGGDWAQPYVEKYYAPDAWVFMDGSPTVKGTQEIVNLMRPFAGITNWRPEHLRVEGQGDFAYVAGLATFDVPGADGKLTTESYRYVEVWRRDAAGTWKVVQDIANREIPAPQQ